MTEEYSAKDIRSLTDIEQLRINPEMYIGHTENPTHLIEECFDNACDEAQGGYVKVIAINISIKDKICTVLDDGRGIPISNDVPVTISSKLHTGAKFKDNKTAYQISCLVGSTKIFLINGESISIQEMSNNQDKEYFGLSSTLDGKWETTSLLNAQITGYTNKLIRVYLDNDCYEECSPDHLWLMKNGSYKKAKDLCPNDSLMPCYYKIDSNGYLVVKQNNTYNYIRNIQFENRKNIPIHRIVYTTYNSTIPFDFAIHHKDFNKLNNHYDNLELVDNKKEHLKKHIKHLRDNKIINSDGLVKYNKSKRGREKSREIGIKWGTKNIVKYSKSERNRQDKKRMMTDYNKSVSQHELQRLKVLKYAKTLVMNNINITYDNWEKYRPYGVPTYTKVITKYNINDIINECYNYSNPLYKIEETNGKIMIIKRMFSILDKIKEKNKELNEENYNETRGKYDPTIKIVNKYFGNFYEFLNCYIKNNHKVLKIEKIELPEKIPVYDVYAPRNSNFVLSSGVVVHNSGLHGIGLVAVNALSDYMIIEIYRNGRHAIFRFEDSKLKSKKIENINKDFKPPYSTKIEFKANSKIFDSLLPDIDRIRHRLTTASIQMPNIIFVLNVDDKREIFKLTLKDYFETYILNKDNGEIIPRISFNLLNGVEKFNILMTYSEKGNITPIVGSSVNLLPCTSGGTHVNLFYEILRDMFSTKAKKLGYIFQPNDCLVGLRAYLMLSLKEVHFSAQIKDKLTNKKTYFEKFEKQLRTQIDNYFNSNQENLEILLDFFQSYRQKLDSKKLKTVQTNGRRVSTKFTKLRDCVSPNGELYIAEGDSAGGGLIACRDPKKHAIFPLKGKIPSAATNKEILKNKEIVELIKALGTGVGADFDISRLRYNKIIICTDADPDGDHISSLLMLSIAILLPEIVKQGFLYIAVTPLYAINENKIFIPLWDDKQLIEAKKNNRKLIRCKGLGEFNPDQLKTFTTDENTRNLIKVEYSADINVIIKLFTDVQEKRKLLEMEVV